MKFIMRVRPKFSPPGIVFPIAWFILYTLMGISFYIVLQSNDVNKDAGILIYIIQLIFPGSVRISKIFPLNLK